MAGRDEATLNDLTLLGNQNTKYLYEYNPDVLESVESMHVNRDYFVKFNCPEFTSLCPMTGQPDFATMYISFIPDKKLVESKVIEALSIQFPESWGFP